MKRFVDWLENNLGFIVIIAVLFILILPAVLSFPTLFSVFDLSRGKDVGAAIGGITAPVIGILTCLLVYFTFRQQVKFNEKQLENQNYESIEQLINETLNLIENMEWDGSRGVKALLLFKFSKDVQHTLYDEFYIVLLRFQIIEDQCNKISDKNIKEIYKKRIYTLYYTKILWNCFSGLFTEIKNHPDKHDDSQLSMKLYTELSIRTLNYLIENKIIADNIWKKEVIHSLENFF